MPGTGPAAADTLAPYVRSIRRYGLLSPEEERDLAARAHAGEQAAKDALVTANLRLVVKIARAYKGRGIPLCDLVSEGNLGLIHAVGKFDPARGTRFSTYASFWIREAIEKFLMDRSRLVRLPVYVIKELSALLRQRRALSAAGDHELSAHELAERLHLDEARVGELLALNDAPLSLDLAMGDGEGAGISLLDLLPSRDSDTPTRQLVRHELSRLLRDWFNSLEPRQQVVVLHRLGLHDAEIETLRDIGDRIHLTRERVRQIQRHVVALLRDYISEQGLGPEDFADGV